MTRSLQRRTRRTFAWVLVIPLLLGLVSFWAMERYRRSIAWVSHTEEVMLALQDFQTALLEAESSQRGFLLTGDPAFQVRYRQLRDQLPGRIAYLCELTSDNARQHIHLRQLSSSVQARVARMEQVLALQQQGSLREAEAVQAMSVGATMMAHIRQIGEEMRGEERQLLAIRTRAQLNTELEVAVSFLIGIVISLALLYGANRLLQEYGAERDQAERELREVNAELETRVKERTAEWQTANERLRRSNADLMQFAYVASHDLQEPLRTVGSYAGLLGRRYQGQLDEQADRYIRHLVEGAKRMQTLIQDLLAYSRVGTQSLKVEPTDLEDVLRQVQENLQASLSERRASLTHDPLPIVIGDGGRLGQVLQNLIGNALKFAQPGEAPAVHVGVARQEQNWIFSVRDNGIGFEPEYAERIFVIFQRLHSIGAYPGTGIGLAICKRIVEAHGGRIWAESEGGVGSTFFFTLSAQPSWESSETREQAALPPPLSVGGIGRQGEN